MKQLFLLLTLTFFLFSGNQNAFAGAYNPDSKWVTKSSSIEKKVTSKIIQAKETMQKVQKKATFSPDKEKRRTHNYLGGAVKMALLSAIFFAITFIATGTALTIVIACSLIALTVALILFGLWLYNSI